MDWIFDALRIVIPVFAAFVTGYLTALKNDKKSLRTVDAAIYAAARVKDVSTNVAQDMRRSLQSGLISAAAFRQANYLDNSTDMLRHVRATDLPETIEISAIADIFAQTRLLNVVLGQYERLGEQASPSTTTLDEITDVLDTLLERLKTERDSLRLPFWRRALQWVNPASWLGRR